MAARFESFKYYRLLLVVMTGALVLTVLTATRVWNPLPAIAGWWDRLTVLSDPAPSWSVRLGGAPDITAVMATGDVVAASYGSVDAYDRTTGKLLWHYDAAWALPADDVVVIRQEAKNPIENAPPERGYSVVDAASGTVIWGDRDAVAVWAFADRILDLVCPGDGECELRSHSHRDNGHILWTAPMPAAAHTLRGAAPGLVGTRDPAQWFAKAAKGEPPTLPAVIGLRVNGAIEVIDTVAGTHVREVPSPDPQTRVSISGDRVIVAHAEPGDAGCRFWVEGRDYLTDAVAWRTEGLNLDTSSGAGCEQRDDPLGAGARLAGVRGDNDPTLLSSTDGTALWVGVPSEKVLATDGQLAVVLHADRQTVDIYDLLGGATTPVWSRKLGLEPQAAVTPNFVVLVDRVNGTLLVLNHFVSGDGTLHETKTVKTKNDLLAIGPLGLVVASGRRIGFVPFT